MPFMKQAGVLALVLAAGAAWSQTAPQVFVTTQQAAPLAYDSSAQTLHQAASDLRSSIDALATQPPSPARNQAIRDASRALAQTNVAIANSGAYPSTATLGAGSAVVSRQLACAPRLDFWVCQ